VNVKNNKNYKSINKTFERRKSHIKTDSVSSLKTKKKEVKNYIKNKTNNKNFDDKHNTIIDLEHNNNKIISMESNLQKDNSLFQDDPLLVSPITEFDFHLNEYISSNSNNNRNVISDFFMNNEKKNIKIIFEFLCLDDLLKLKCVSKFFNKKIMNYFLNNLIETKQTLENIKKTIVYNPEPKNIKNITFSKGTEKSIKLLNEKINNFFFYETNPPRNNDVLFVYEVFFQLINNKAIIDVKNNKNEFWEKGRFYFLNEGRGKIGDILRKIINNNEIDLSGHNLYKIYELVKNKFNILFPLHFKDICTTTPFFAFYIKDILSF
jgi:hypothetical protein